MGTIVDEAVWQVRGWKYNGDERLGTFRGPSAFNKATDCFDQMKANGELWELWLIRLDGNDWKFQERIRRNADGEWQQIPHDAPTEVPPGMRPEE
jgi:hypothetical protein